MRQAAISLASKIQTELTWREGIKATTMPTPVAARPALALAVREYLLALSWLFLLLVFFPQVVLSRAKNKKVEGKELEVEAKISNVKMGFAHGDPEEAGRD